MGCENKMCSGLTCKEVLKERVRAMEAEKNAGGVKTSENVWDFANEDGLNKIVKKIDGKNIIGTYTVDKYHEYNYFNAFYSGNVNNERQETHTFGGNVENYYEVLGDDVGCAEIINVFSLYYKRGEEVTRGFRLGANNQIASLYLGDVVEGTKLFVKVGRYFYYDYQTGEKVYDEDCQIIVNGTNYVIDSDEVLIPITENVIEISKEAGRGRVILYSFSLLLDEDDVYDVKELASKELVEDLHSEALMEIADVSNALNSHQEDNEIEFSEVKTLINTTKRDIESKIGSVQISNRDWLPEPSEQFINKIIRTDGTLFQCLVEGKEIDRYADFSKATGTSEITKTNADTFLQQIGISSVMKLHKDDEGDWSVFEDIYDPVSEMYGDVNIINIQKTFRNSGDGIKFGNSSTSGCLRLMNTSTLPIKQIKVGVKAYAGTSGNKSSGFQVGLYKRTVNEEGDIIYVALEVQDVILLPGRTHTFVLNEDRTIDVGDLGYGTVLLIKNFRPPETGDYRAYVESLSIELGEAEYTWEAIGNSKVDSDIIEVEVTDDIWTSHDLVKLENLPHGSYLLHASLSEPSVDLKLIWDTPKIVICSNYFMGQHGEMSMSSGFLVGEPSILFDIDDDEYVSLVVQDGVVIIDIGDTEI